MTASPRVIDVADGERLTVLTCRPAAAASAALSTCKRALVIVGPDTPAEIAATAAAFQWRPTPENTWRCNLHGSIRPARH